MDPDPAFCGQRSQFCRLNPPGDDSPYGSRTVCKLERRSRMGGKPDNRIYP